MQLSTDQQKFSNAFGLSVGENYEKSREGGGVGAVGKPFGNLSKTDEANERRKWPFLLRFTRKPNDYDQDEAGTHTQIYTHIHTHTNTSLCCLACSPAPTHTHNECLTKAHLLWPFSTERGFSHRIYYGHVLYRTERARWNPTYRNPVACLAPRPLSPGILTSCLGIIISTETSECPRQRPTQR